MSDHTSRNIVFLQGLRPTSSVITRAVSTSNNKTKVQLPGFNDKQTWYHGSTKFRNINWSYAAKIFVIIEASLFDAGER